MCSDTFYYLIDSELVIKCVVGATPLDCTDLRSKDQGFETKDLVVTTLMGPIIQT